MTIPALDQSRTHIVGIGGIGMSGIAEIMHKRGMIVSGSDQVAGANVVRLREMGVPVMVGHAASNVDGVDVLVVSSAISDKNDEVIAAREQGIPVPSRSDNFVIFV